MLDHLPARARENLEKLFKIWKEGQFLGVWSWKSKEQGKKRIPFFKSKGKF